ncbi:MAG: HAD family hydrolase [Syntrophomonadales bacterium]
MKVAIFDFDGTLTTRDTLPCLGKDWIRQGRSRVRYVRILLSALPHLILWKAGALSRERMKVRVMRRFNNIFRGMSGEEITEFFALAYHNLKDILNPAVIDEVKAAKSEGFYTVLLSGAHAGLLRHVGEDLGFDCVIGVDLPLCNGSFDHRQPAAFIDGQAKLALIREHLADREIDWQASRSYGDSYDDLKVLEIVGNPVAVNAEPRLAGYAREKNWRVLSARN